MAETLGRYFELRPALESGAHFSSISDLAETVLLHKLSSENRSLQFREIHSRFPLPMQHAFTVIFDV